MSNDFTIRGSLRIAEGVRENLQWQDAFVTREYVCIVQRGDEPVEGAVVRIMDEALTTNEHGAATFSIRFDETNYNEPQRLEVLVAGELYNWTKVDFFTESPIVVR